jgi:hypothetical protein
MIQLFGFNSQPYSMIIWQNDKAKSKTVCLSPEDEHMALNRFYTTGDFYNTYDKAIVIRQDETIQIEKGVKMNVAI